MKNPLSEGQLVLIFLISSSSLSILGSAVLIITYWYAKGKQIALKLPSNLIFYLGLFDFSAFGIQFLESLLMLLNKNISEETFCAAFASLKNYCLLGSIFMNAMASYCIRALMTTSEQEQQEKKLREKSKLFICFSLILPLFLIIIVQIFTISFGYQIEQQQSKDVPYCFIHLKTNIKTFDVPGFFAFYLPLFIVLGNNCWQYCKYFNVWESPISIGIESQEGNQMKKQIRRKSCWLLSSFWVLLFGFGAVSIHSLVTFGWKFTEIGGLSYYVGAISLLIAFLSGFWNFIIQGLCNDEINNYVLFILTSCCRKKCMQQREIIQNEEIKNEDGRAPNYVDSLLIQNETDITSTVVLIENRKSGH